MALKIASSLPMWASWAASGLELPPKKNIDASGNNTGGSMAFDLEARGRWEAQKSGGFGKLLNWAKVRLVISSERPG